jgi:glycine/D-amino acid oxidase-like deaminating enzyme
MYDAIVVGARCAGASTAMLLARRGHRVLPVDRVRRSSATPAVTRTHTWPSGSPIPCATRSCSATPHTKAYPVICRWIMPLAAYEQLRNAASKVD